MLWVVRPGVAMQIPTGKLESIRKILNGVLERIGEMDETMLTRDGNAPDLPTLMQAFEQLLDVMQRLEVDLDAGNNNPANTEAGVEDVTEIGEYALRLH